MTILITGSSGFVGTSFRRIAEDTSLSLIALSRNPLPSTKYVSCYKYPTSVDQWLSILGDVSCIIHLAGRAHVLNDSNDDPLSAYRLANVQNSCFVAKLAIEAGVKRFVFVSSVKVNGESTTSNSFRPSDIPRPSDPYSISKYEAEIKLTKLFSDSDSELVIVRPPLIYGPNVKGNLKLISSLIKLGIPLPVMSLNTNLRSIVYVDNLVHFLIHCSKHSLAGGKTFLIDDGRPLSTLEIFDLVSLSLGASSKFFSLPKSILYTLFSLLGKSSVYNRLTQSLVVDSYLAFDLLEWNPPYSSKEGFLRL